MLFDAIITMTQNIIIAALNGVETLNLPLSFIGVLTDVTAFGVWVLGADLCLYIMSCLAFWAVFKLTVGALVFIWRLLPFT